MAAGLPAEALTDSTGFVSEVIRTAPTLLEPEQEQTFDLVLPLIVNQQYLGDVSARATASGSIERIDGVRVLALLTPLLTEQAAAELAAAVTPDQPLVVLDQLQTAAVQVTYDSSNLQLVGSISADATPVNALSLAPTLATGPGPNDDLPARFSTGLNLFASQTHVDRSNLSPQDEGLESIIIGVDGIANFGGLDGLYLFHRWTYEDDTLRRGATTLIRDDRRRAVRYAFGDIDPLTTELQGAPSLGGLQVATAYSEIQPTRNVRPVGRSSFVLDREGVVEVEVNGIVTRTLQLGAGQYDIRDLTFAEGLNDVRLFVQDAAGRREIASLSTAFSSTLLASDVVDFSVAAGFARTPSERGFDYDDDRPQVSGFYRRGLTPTVTGGASFQADKDVLVAGGDVVWALPLGTLRAEAAASDGPLGDGFAVSTAWRSLFEIQDYPAELEGFWQHTSADFAVVGRFPVQNDISNDYGVRYRQTLPMGWSFGTSFNRIERRSGLNETRTSGSASRSFGPLSVSVLAEDRRGGLFGNEQSALVTLTYRLGLRNSARLRYDSRTQLYRGEFERAPRDIVNDFGYRLSAGTTDADRVLEGQIDYFGNRGEIGLRTDYFSDRLSPARRQETTLRVATAIGYADGAVAIGRPFDSGFAIVRPYRNLGSRPVNAFIGGARGDVYARSGPLGPALVTLPRAYQTNAITIDVDDLPVGYDLGAAGFRPFSGAASGFLLEAGSDAAATLSGRLIDRDGAPVALVVGEARSVERPQDPPTPFFTNRGGRFVAEKMRPGRYALFIGNQDTGLIVTVPADTLGLADVGTLQIMGR